MQTHHRSLKKMSLPTIILFCNIGWSYCWGFKHIQPGYDHNVKLLSSHFFAKTVQLIKPQLQYLQWKQTLYKHTHTSICIYTFLTHDKVLCFTHDFSLRLKTLETKQPENPVVPGTKSPPLCALLKTAFITLQIFVQVPTQSLFTLSKLLLHLGGSSPAAAWETSLFSGLQYSCC